MKNLIKLVTLTLISLLLIPQNTNAQCHIDDWTALKALYQSTNGDNWSERFGWDVFINNQNSPPAGCDLNALYGVTCDFDGRVICIDLDGYYNCNYDGNTGNNLTGSLPSEIGNLIHLQWLSLANNNISGIIPTEIGDLTSLTILGLSSNELTGDIPAQIGNLVNLTDLGLYSNMLATLPSQIGNLTSLTELNLSYNNIAAIPSQIGNLINLTELNLLDNNITIIPSQIGNLTNLTELNLAQNTVTTFPSSISNLNNLTILNLGHNNLTTIPSQITNLINLKELYLNSNDLYGSLPAAITNMSNLERLSLSFNNLSGSISTNIANLINLEYLDLGYNDFTFQIPPQLGNLTNLTNLYLRSNNLSGSIPLELGNLTDLEKLYLNNNQFGGEIPTILGNLTNLRSLELHNNFFVGPIPASLGNLSNLNSLKLYDNLLSGELPSELCNLNMLTTLFLSQNNLEGCFPACYIDFCTQLSSYNFNDNNFNCTWEDFCSNINPCDCTDPNACNYNSNASCDDGSCNYSCSVSVWPGDLNVDGICNHRDIAYSHLFIGESGPNRNPGGISWQAQTCEDWGIPQANGQDIKHHDCDGNGNINTNDANAITLNYNKTHPLPLGISAPSNPVFLNTDFQIDLQPINDITTSNTIVMDVVMESKTNTDLDVFAGYFTIDISDIAQNVDNSFIIFESLSWLGIPHINLLAKSWYNAEEKIIEVGFTRTNGLISSGKGVIAKLFVDLGNTNLNRNSACENLIEIRVKEIGSFDKNENSLEIEEEYAIINLGTPCCEPFININEETPFQNLYKSSGTITTNDYLSVGQNQEVEYNGNRVTLNTGFSVKAGADFKVRSSGCN